MKDACGCARDSLVLLIWKVRAEVVCLRSGFKWEYPLCCGGKKKRFLKETPVTGMRSPEPGTSPTISAYMPTAGRPDFLSYPAPVLFFLSFFPFMYNWTVSNLYGSDMHPVSVMTPDRAAPMTFSGNLSYRNSAPWLKLDILVCKYALLIIELLQAHAPLAQCVGAANLQVTGHFDYLSAKAAGLMLLYCQWAI